MSAEQKMPSVYVIIVNWNAWQDTLECLESLGRLSYPQKKIVVVDNGSTDGSQAHLGGQDLGIELVLRPTNAGFAAASNEGIRLALERKADYTLLLNNDTVVAPDLIEAFLAAAHQCPQAAAFGAKIYYYDEPDTIWYAGGRERGLGVPPAHRGDRELEHGQYDQMVETPFVNGSAFFVRSTALDEVGLLDERYFHMFEDADWSMRFWERGFACLFVPQARVWHKIGIATGGRGRTKAPCYSYYYERNRLLWVEKHHPGLSRLAMLWLSIRSLCLGVGQSFSIRRPRTWWSAHFGSWRNWLAMLLGVLDFWRGRFGPCPTAVQRLQTSRRLHANVCPGISSGADGREDRARLPHP